MDFFKNERGYTLVIVLLMITLIFTFSAVLIRGNINSARQIRVTEEHHQAIALAEMGIEYAEASIRHNLETLDVDEIVTDIQGGNSGLSEEAIVREIAARVVANISAQSTWDDKDFAIDISVGEAKEDEMVFVVESIGSSDRDYKITADIAVPTMVTVTPDTGEELEWEFADPNDFPEREGIRDSIRDNIDSLVPLFPRDNVFPIVDGGGNFGGGTEFPQSTRFTGRVRMNPNSSLWVNGNLHHTSGEFELGRNATVDIVGNARFTDVRSDTRSDERSSLNITEYVRSNTFNVPHTDIVIGGGISMTGTATFNNSTLDNKGDFHSSNAVAISNKSVIKVGGNTALQNTSVVIDDSNVVIKGSEITALNRPEIRNNSTVQTGNLRTNGLILTNSTFDVIDGGFRLEGGGGTVTNSTLTVQGHLFAGGVISLNSGSAMIVYGDFLDRIWRPIVFGGGGSRVIIFGEWQGTTLNAVLAQNGVSSQNATTFEEAKNAVVPSNQNIIFFVDEDPPPPINGNGGEGESGGNIEVNLGDVSLRNVQYVG